MTANRIKELRLVRKLTQAKLAELTGFSDHTAVQKHENDKRGLSMAVAQRYAAALGVEITEVFGVARTNALAEIARGGFHEEAEPYKPQHGEFLPIKPPKGENIDPWVLKTDAVSRAGYKERQVVFVNTSAEAVENIEPLKCVLAQIYGKLGTKEEMTAMTIVRQFVPPSLLITNSDTVCEAPLDLERDDVHIKGVIVGSYFRG